MIKKTIHKGLWLAAGITFTVIGFICLLLPVVPQLIFFLLATVCFMRSSDRFRDWIHRKSWFIRLSKRFHHLRHHDT